MVATAKASSAIVLTRNFSTTARSAGARPSDDELEAVVRAYREQHGRCPTCGPRPEPDAVFCSNCGRYLRDMCAGCGAHIEAQDARYCVNCGSRLAA